MRLLVVDDDAGLRALLRATFEVVDIEVQEAESAAIARIRIGAVRPDVIILDVVMPGLGGLEFCRMLKDDPATCEIPVVLLTGSEGETPFAADAAGADALVRKPFSPLELLALVERLADEQYGGPFRIGKNQDPEEQLLLCARDLRHLLEGQRIAAQKRHRETAAALATALESKDAGTRAHAQRVQQYALALARSISPALADDPSAEYGFLLHDVGKIGIPDSVLGKPGPLTPGERRLMETHTTLGEQMLGGVAFLQGHGLAVVRSHHERWDGRGYPDGLRGEEIPLGARVFAVADTLDAMTSDRVYRPALPWREAHREILRQAGRQFDRDIVDAFRQHEHDLRQIHVVCAAAA